MVGQAASDASLIGGALHSLNDIGGSDWLGYNKAADNRQYEQQGRLMEQQITGNEQLADYSTMKQKEIWDYTNFENQVKHLEQAGLNPGLLYAKGGPGGTTGSVSAGSVSSGQAANSAQTKQADLQAVGMGLQLQMMQSQIRVNDAQARDISASANLKENYQPGNIEAHTSLLTQQAKTEQEKQIAIKLDNEFNEIRNNIQKATSDAQISTYIANLSRINADIRNIDANTALAQASEKEKYAMIDQIGAQILLLGSKTYKNYQEAAQGWEQLKVQWANNAATLKGQQVSKENVETTVKGTLDAAGIHLLGTKEGFIVSLADMLANGKLWGNAGLKNNALIYEPE